MIENGELLEVPVRMCRFLLVIGPDERTEEQVRQWKAMLRERIGGYSGSRSVPHITLFFADLPSEWEHDVIEGVRQGCMGHHAFTLHLNGITHFPDKRTIYIDPVEKDAIAVVRKSIASHVRAFRHIKKLGVNATDHPHLTIAAGLKPHQFERAWNMLAPHAYTSEQRVDEVRLLRRDLKAGAVYEVVKNFPLEL
jgi:2'-5' RNA ligase